MTIAVKPDIGSRHGLGLQAEDLERLSGHKLYCYYTTYLGHAAWEFQFTLVHGDVLLAKQHSRLRHFLQNFGFKFVGPQPGVLVHGRFCVAYFYCHVFPDLPLLGGLVRQF